jgi:hypothetical protein
VVSLHPHEGEWNVEEKIKDGVELDDVLAHIARCLSRRSV